MSTLSCMVQINVLALKLTLRWWSMEDYRFFHITGISNVFQFHLAYGLIYWIYCFHCSFILFSLVQKKKGTWDGSWSFCWPFSCRIRKHWYLELVEVIDFIYKLTVLHAILRSASSLLWALCIKFDDEIAS